MSSSQAHQLKPAATITDHIERLRSRGMIISDEMAQQWLSNVSYYRLSAYWFPARMVNTAGEKLDEFNPKTSFEAVVELYEADRKLRTLIHDGIERIEISLRTQITDYICLTNGTDPLAYKDPTLFRPSFKHLNWISTIYSRLARAHARNEAIKHYQDNYGAQFPLWLVAEALDFSDISKLYGGLKTHDQYQVAEKLNIQIDHTQLSKSQARQTKKKHPLATWLEQLTVVRNTCAHHGRLWNKSFLPAQTEALRTSGHFDQLPEQQSERIFGTLVVMSHLLRTISPGTTWPEKVDKLIKESFITNPIVKAESLGIPSDWNGSL
ncbi:Abi family protein [Corynebacterium sp.]|uniref:Abi family protein n=1 Tax=Corynebacterium sp. TaxID=1720 RepID=UPI0026DD9540|nr:Abi family protein [Corynebacterium sp.]